MGTAAGSPPAPPARRPLGIPGRRTDAATAGLRPGPTRVAHVDWEPRNVRWRGSRPRVVHDWESVAAVPEPVAVGLGVLRWLL
jgi:hypothetical protein